MPHTTILSPADASKQLQNPNWAFIDCRFALSDPDAGRTAFQQAHIPGAVYAHLDEDLSSTVTPTSGRHPLPNAETLAGKLGKWGIGPKSQVVIYDDASGAFAARLWWLLRWLGHEKAAVLDGGLAAWRSAGLPTTAEIVIPRAKEFQGTPDNTLWLSSEAVESALAFSNSLLLDARGPERYRGEVEPVDPVAGHVPGAVNTPFGENTGPEGAFLPAADLRARFAPLAEQTGEDGVIHMCGSGVTACHNSLAMAVAGLPMGKLYAGSWSEWIRDANRPVARGS